MFDIDDNRPAIDAKLIGAETVVSCTTQVNRLQAITLSDAQYKKQHTHDMNALDTMSWCVEYLHLKHAIADSNTTANNNNSSGVTLDQYRTNAKYTAGVPLIYVTHDKNIIIANYPDTQTLTGGDVSGCKSTTITSYIAELLDIYKAGDISDINLGEVLFTKDDLHPTLMDNINNNDWNMCGVISTASTILINMFANKIGDKAADFYKEYKDLFEISDTKLTRQYVREVIYPRLCRNIRTVINLSLNNQIHNEELKTKIRGIAQGIQHVSSESMAEDIVQMLSDGNGDINITEVVSITNKSHISDLSFLTLLSVSLWPLYGTNMSPVEADEYISGTTNNHSDKIKSILKDAFETMVANNYTQTELNIQNLYVSPTPNCNEFTTEPSMASMGAISANTVNHDTFTNLGGEMDMVVMAENMWAGRVLRSVGQTMETNKLVVSRINPFLTYVPGYPVGWHDNIDIQTTSTNAPEYLMFSKYLYSPTKK